MADKIPAKDFVLVIDTRTQKKSRVPAHFLNLFPYLKPAHERPAPIKPVAEPKAPTAITKKES
jgi:hypothetical protein